MKGLNFFKIQIQVFTFFLCSIQAVFASDELASGDVRSFSLGNIRAVSNELLNPATLPFPETGQAGISVFNRFQINELNTVQAYCTYPNRWLDAGFKITTFGYEDYRITAFQGSFAKKLSPDFAVGIQLGYQNEFSILDDTHNYLSAGLGMYYRMNEQIDLALLGENLLHTFPGNHRNVYAGVKYEAVKNTAFFLEAGYVPEQRFKFSAGCEYSVWEQFTFRAGFDSSSATSSFGVAYRWKRWSMEVGFSVHSNLGNSSGIGINYEL